MEYTILGSSDLQVSRIGLGTWAIGGWKWGGPDEMQAIKAIHQALDFGITLIDTAPVYGFGLSEDIVGKAVAKHGSRDKVVLATKAGLSWDSRERVWRDSSPQKIRRELEDSLRRLQTDYLDLYQIHWPDSETPIANTAETLSILLQQGKIRAIGVSNFSSEQMSKWRQIAPLHCCQTQYNLLQRHYTDVFDYCAANNIGTLTWGSLAHGLLTGKFTTDAVFPKDDFRPSKPLFQGQTFRQYIKAVDRLKDIAGESGHTVVHLAIRWLLQQHGVTTALWGARRPEQLAEVAEIFEWTLSQDDLYRIEQVLQEIVTDPDPKPENPGPPTRSQLMST